MDGIAVESVAELDYSNGGIKTKQPFRIGAGEDEDSGFVGSIDEVAVYDRDLTQDEVAILGAAESLGDIARMPAGDRTQGQALKLERAFADSHGPPEVRSAWSDLVRLRKEREALLSKVSSVMIMAEMDPPRETFVLDRGAYDKPSERVLPGVLSVLPALPESVRNDPAGPGTLAGRSSKSTDCSGHGEPVLADAIRCWARPDPGKPWNAGRASDSSGTLGLAGCRVRRERLGT